MKLFILTVLAISFSLPAFANKRTCEASLTNEAYEARRAYADQDWNDMLDLVEAERAIDAMRETRARSVYEINGFSMMLEDNRNELILRMGYQDYEAAYQEALRLRFAPRS